MRLRVALLLGSALLGVTSPALAAPQRLGPEAARAFRDAYQALTRGDYAQAEAGFRSLASTPSLLSDYALYYLGESLVRSGTQTEARQVFQAVQDQYPGSRLVPQALATWEPNIQSPNMLNTRWRGLSGACSHM